MTLYDVTVPITPRMHVYPGDPPPVLEPRCRIVDGDPANVCFCGMGTHTGTHIDAPYHFIETGRKLHDIPLNLMIGKVRVVEVTSKVIDAETLSRLDIGEHIRVIFKTRNSQLWAQEGFAEDYVYIAPDAARVLVENGVKLVGIDYLSVEQYGSTGFPTHLELLSNNVVIVEGLDLREVDAGDYELFCLPLKLMDSDGAPARVILRG
jgi:arylformamidase